MVKHAYEAIYIRRRHTYGEGIHIKEKTYGDIYTKRHTWRDVRIKDLRSIAEPSQIREIEREVRLRDRAMNQ